MPRFLNNNARAVFNRQVVRGRMGTGCQQFAFGSTTKSAHLAQNFSSQQAVPRWTARPGLGRRLSTRLTKPSGDRLCVDSRSHQRRHHLVVALWSAAYLRASPAKLTAC